eukprot:3871226-Pleurochrysis_carterae.AAC.1
MLVRACACLCVRACVRACANLHDQPRKKRPAPPSARSADAVSGIDLNVFCSMSPCSHAHVQPRTKAHSHARTESRTHTHSVTAVSRTQARMQVSSLSHAHAASRMRYPRAHDGSLCLCLK